MTSLSDPRALLLDRIVEDLFGPEHPVEVLSEKPGDRYLTGILFPQRQAIGAEEDDSLDLAPADENESSVAAEDEVPSSFMQKPSAAGVSFRCEAEAGPTFEIRVSGGTYQRERAVEEPISQLDGDEDAGATRRSRSRYQWRRTDHNFSIPFAFADLQKPFSLEPHGLLGFHLHFKMVRLEDEWLITVVLVNGNDFEAGTDRPDELALFQASLEVRPASGTRIIARQIRSAPGDEDGEIARLLYRNVREYAVGHTCSARWEESADRTATLVATTWFPASRVLLVSADGSTELQHALQGAPSDPLLAEAYTEPTVDIRSLLSPLIEGYESWIKNQRAEATDLTEDLQRVAAQNLTDCTRAAERMRGGITLLEQDVRARLAFRLMNRAMTIQRRWVRGQILRWRPFQLGFILQCLESVADPKSDDRNTMDLLWFPTGGGKTEAYLGLIAFTLFLRRLRTSGDSDAGAGVACIMRYTLRLLTLQQFQRAAALTLACEYVRSGEEMPDESDAIRESAPISIGLWVGDTATANHFAAAAEALSNPLSPNSPKQLSVCPCCKQLLSWTAEEAAETIEVRCTNTDCELARTVPRFPVFTVDDDVYRERPSLLIGTADKFAQIVRSVHTLNIFNIGHAAPPELIIQDELHLISGPLGTLAALYEAAIDLICTRAGARPKIIGSTATIRRARDQVRALFDRDVAQFPPAGINADNSGFAVVPEDAKNRQYVGITTAGRSAKFTLQAVYASLLQGSTAINSIDERDGYHTLVGYFNALRELGGALVLVRDDVAATARLLAGRRGEPVRESRELVELTSRVNQREIRETLEQLELKYPADAAIDAVLATNMVSVGVDVGRLALMVVMGQPKSIAEYIQATSRVGREDNQGLVVSVLNNAKTRDRSRYETFLGWHMALYKGVEPTSVTPFASRARDRALHAALVAVARHLVDGMSDGPRFTQTTFDNLTGLSEKIAERAANVDLAEEAETRHHMTEILTEWRHRSNGLQSYWNDHRPGDSLMISAELAAARQLSRAPGNPWPTLNSLRTVEPGTPFRLVEALKGPANGQT